MNTEQLNSVQKFLQRLNTDPPLDSIDKTPDGKAYTVVISHIETTLDELFFGRWSTQNFRWHAIANEVQGSLDLVVINPVTGESITRTGAASIVIMVDKIPDELKDNPQQKNQWALNPSNKKSNALDLAFPKLKAECLKNAAQSLGKLFGRDLNRRIKDTYKPFKFTQEDTGLKQLPQSTMQKIEKAINDGIEEFEIRQQLDTISELISDEQMNRINELINSRS